MIKKCDFIREFSALLKREAKPRHRVLDWSLKQLRKKERFQRYELNNPDVFKKLEDARDVPIERVRILANTIYNVITDK